MVRDPMRPPLSASVGPSAEKAREPPFAGGGWCRWTSVRCRSGRGRGRRPRPVAAGRRRHRAALVGAVVLRLGRPEPVLDVVVRVLATLGLDRTTLTDAPGSGLS